MAEPAVVPAGAPATQPANTMAFTEENLDANIQAALNPPTDANAGVPAETPPVATQAPEGPPAATVPPVEGTPAETPPAEADTGKAQRISQQNAQMKAALIKMGVDPDSDTMEAIASGLVTPEEVRAARQPVQPQATAAPPVATAPEVPLSQQISNLKGILDTPVPSDGLSANDVQDRQKALLGVVEAQAKQIDQITKAREQDQRQDAANNVISATQSVFESTVLPTLPANLPDDVKKAASDMFLGATEMENINLIRDYGAEKANTPEGYKHSATQVAPKFNQLLKAAFDAGAASSNPNAVPANTAPANTVTPMRPGTRGGSPPPPANKNQFSLQNLDNNVDAFLATQEGRV